MTGPSPPAESLSGSSPGLPPPAPLPLPREGAAGAASAAPAQPRAEVQATLPPQAAAATEDWVAQQLDYWIGQNVQAAELRLDGAGGDAVEVRIELTGKEARVEFRSDLAQTRELLAGAAHQLQDLLSSRGLVLADVSVSSSDRGAAQQAAAQHGGQRREDGGGRAAGTADRAAAAGSAARPALAGPSGRVLDLFV